MHDTEVPGLTESPPLVFAPLLVAVSLEAMVTSDMWGDVAEMLAYASPIGAFMFSEWGEGVSDGYAKACGVGLLLYLLLGFRLRHLCLRHSDRLLHRA